MIEKFYVNPKGFGFKFHRGLRVNSLMFFMFVAILVLHNLSHQMIFFYVSSYSPRDSASGSIFSFRDN